MITANNAYNTAISARLTARDHEILKLFNIFDSLEGTIIEQAKKGCFYLWCDLPRFVYLTHEDIMNYCSDYWKKFGYGFVYTAYNRNLKIEWDIHEKE